MKIILPTIDGILSDNRHIINTVLQLVYEEK